MEMNVSLSITSDANDNILYNNLLKNNKMLKRCSENINKGHAIMIYFVIRTNINASWLYQKKYKYKYRK